MFRCFGLRLHRHQLHLASYGCVSLSLIFTGIVFTVFAVFQKDSQIGKVWLAGPVLIVVGSVLCGKVMIDWGPAMERGRAGSVDSRLVDEFGYSNLLSIGGGSKAACLSPEIAHQLKIPINSRAGGGPSSPTAAGLGNGYGNISPFINQQIPPSAASPSLSTGGQFGPYDCITYSPAEPSSPSCRSSEKRDLADKTTQAKEEGCEKCANLWAILDRRKTTAADPSKSPKVIGKFVFSGPNYHDGPSQQQQQQMNYGTLVGENTNNSPTNNHLPPSQNNNVGRSTRSSNNGRGGRRKFYSQGETLIMNERSFLI